MFTYEIDHEISLALPRPNIDVEPMFNLIKDSYEELRIWLPWVNSLKEIDNEYQFLKSELNKFINNEALSTIILYNGKQVGMISLNRFFSLNNSTDVGYWLGTEFVGHNIMHHAVYGICDIGFQDYNLNKIEIHAAIDNARSNSVAKNAGFHFEGVNRALVKLDDGYHDGNLWSMLKDEWK